MTKGTLALFVMALVAAGAIGYGVGSSQQPVRMDTGPSSQPAQPAAAPARSRDVAPPTVPNSPAQARGAPDSASPPPIPAGSGKVTGRVMTADGRPLAGATIRLQPTWHGTPSSYRAGSGPPKMDDIEALVRRYRKIQEYYLKGTREATSAGDGTYEVDGLGDADYYPRAWCKGYQIRPTRYGRVHAGDNVDFTARVLVGIEIEVLLPDGTQAKKAQFHYSTDSRGVSNRNWLPAQPFVDLDPGDYTLWATGGPNGIYESKKRDLTIREGQTASKVTLQLEDRPGIYGEVSFPPNEASGMSGSWYVTLVRSKGSGAPDPRRLAHSVKRHWLSTMGSARSYSFRELAPATYDVAIVSGQDVLVYQTVTVSNAMQKVDLAVPAMDDSNSVHVRVLGPSGRAVRNVGIYLRISSPHGSSGETPRYARLDDGTYRVADPKASSDDSTNTHYFLSFRSASYGGKEVEFTPGATTDLTVQFDEPATLEVTVSGYDANGYDGTVALRLMRILSGSPGSHHIRYGMQKTKQVTSNGRAKLSGLTPGRYELQVGYRTLERNWQEATLQKTEIQLQSGANSTAVSLPRLYSLTVVAKGVRQGSSVWIVCRKDSTRNRYSQVDSDGEAVFSSLLPGDYEVRCGRNEVAHVTIPGTSTVTLHPAPRSTRKSK